MSEKPKTSKNTKIIIAVVVVLLPIVVILAVLNFREMADRLEYHIEGSFRVVIGDDYRHISLHDLVNLSPQEIIASERGNPRIFLGVSLPAILEYSGLNYAAAVSLQFISIDGFRTAISMSEALEYDNAFIVFEENGTALGERPGLWGDAPLMLVMNQDPFPNRWARYIIEIVLQ
jgi:hypothetical protein